MTEAEKNERIKAVEEEIAKLQKELEDIRKEKTSEWDFSEWDYVLKSATIKIFDDTKEQFINKVFKPRMMFLEKLVKFKYRYDRAYVPNWSDIYEVKWCVFYNHRSNKYIEASATNAKSTETLYFSSQEIAQKCCDWLNAGCPGYLEEE